MIVKLGYTGTVVTHRQMEEDWTSPNCDRWDELARDCPQATPFQSSTWLRLWWKHFGRGRRPHLWIVSEGDDWVGAWPGYSSSIPWRSLRTMGTGPSDYLMPLVRPGYESVVAQAWQEHLDQLNNVDLVDLHQIREGHPWVESGGVPMRQATCLVLKLEGTFESYCKGLSKSLRYEVQRLKKPPYTTQEAQIRTAATPDEAREFLSVFFRLHQQRWRKRGLPGAFASARVRRFHMEFVSEAVTQDLLRLSVLEKDGTQGGALYAMRAGSGTFFYQSGFDPAAKALSPGTVLVAAAIRRAYEDGCADFDFLRGDEPYKQRWKPQLSLANYRIMHRRAGWRGQAGEHLNRLGFGVETRVRRRLEGRGLLS